LILLISSVVIARQAQHFLFVQYFVSLVRLLKERVLNDQ
jgi:hypothetical protein